MKLEINAKNLRFVSMIHQSKLTGQGDLEGILLDRYRLVATDGFALAMAEGAYRADVGKLLIKGLPYNLPNVEAGENAELSYTLDWNAGDAGAGTLTWPTGKTYPVTVHLNFNFPEYMQIVPDFDNPVPLASVPLALMDTAKVVSRMNDPKTKEERDTYRHVVGGYFGFKDKPTWQPNFVARHRNMTYVRAGLQRNGAIITEADPS